MAPEPPTARALAIINTRYDLLFQPSVGGLFHFKLSHDPLDIGVFFKVRVPISASAGIPMLALPAGCPIAQIARARLRLPPSYRRLIAASAVTPGRLGRCIGKPGVPSTGKQMRFEKTLLDKSAKALLAKAEDCFDLAKTQHDIADKQHEIAASQHDNADSLDTNADKLDALGHALEADAVELKGETEIIAVRTSPPLQEGAEPVPPKAASSKPPTIVK